MTVEEIVSTLIEVGFDKKKNNGEEYYEFYQEYPQDVFGSNLYVRFENYKPTFVHLNCHNFGQEFEIEMISKVELLNYLDYIVLEGRDAWIYSSMAYFDWGPAADNQRKRYFEKRMLMDIKPDRNVIDNIEEAGLDHFKTNLDVEYRGKKIGSMRWEELATALVETQTQKV